MRNLVQCFIYSAGVILLFLASALFLVNLTNPADLAPANDPILHVALSRIFWIIGGIGLTIALVCLCAGNRALQGVLLLWVAGSFLACRMWLFLSQVSAVFTGYLGDLAGALGLRAGTADRLLMLISLYLFIGGVLTVAIESSRKTFKKRA